MVQQDLQSRLQRIKEIESGMPQKVLKADWKFHWALTLFVILVYVTHV